MNIFKRFALLFATLITILVGLPTTSYIAVSAEETNSNISINQSIEDDLKTFNFDYERYFLTESEYLHPVVVNFRESRSSDYYDLLYVYARKNLYQSDSIRFNSLQYKLFVGDSIDEVTKDKSDYYSLCDKKILYQDFIHIEETDGYLFRLAFSSSYSNVPYRYYQFTKLDVSYLDEFSTSSEIVELDNSYLFDNSLSFIYSNCINVILEDAHCWSWHFDEDSGWENFWEWWSGNKTDLLNDQLFYSFYVKNWNIKELKSIDLKYKKALLEGYRHNEADVGNKNEFYQGYTGTYVDPKYYLWNDNNKKGSYDKSIFLGNSIQEISNKIDYEYDTIKADEVVNVSTIERNYKWNKILNIDEFKSSFGLTSDIYKFASNFFENQSTEKYWIINFDEYYYYYLKTQASYYSSVKGSYFHPEDVDDHSLEMSDFINYCESHGLSSQVTGSSGDYGSEWTSKYYEVYQFIQEYVFDMSALKMTFEDYGGNEYELPISVAPVNQEGSGGTSLRPFDDDWLLKLIALIVGILVVIIFLPVLIPVFKGIIKIIILPFKWIIKLFKKNNKKEK